MILSPSTQRIVGLAMITAHLGTLLVPVNTARAAAPTTPGWVSPAVVRSHDARPNRPKPVTPPDLTPNLPEMPTSDQLRRHRALAVPLVRRGNADPDEQGRRDLAKVLNDYAGAAERPTKERLHYLTDYLAQNSQSPYAGALWSEVATRADASGDFKTAFSACQSAWDANKTATASGGDSASFDLANRALARLLRL